MPLWIAAQNGHAGAALLLCQAGADAAATRLAGDSCLDAARRNGHRGVAKVLLRFGA